MSTQVDSCCVEMEFLVCPCILLGNIESKLHRESPVCRCSTCPECELGPHGQQSCLYTCFLAACGWPVSPCLSCHLLHMRHKFHTLYEYDDRIKLPNSSWLWCRSFCCWCGNLKEQYKFVKNLWDDNRLTFHWDFDNYKDQLGPRPVYPSKTILIFAPQNFSTTTFMNKFLRHTSVSANIAATTGSSKQLQHFLTPEMIDLEHAEQIETGMKSHMDKNGNVSFLEVWKIPPGKFHSQTLAQSIKSALVSYYLFDLSDRESIDKVKKAFTEHGYYSTGRRLAIVLNENPQDNKEEPEPSSARKKKKVAFSFDENDEGVRSEDGFISGKSSPRDPSGESPELSPLVTPILSIPNRTLRDLQTWARQHSTMLYEVSLTKPDDFAQLYTILSEALQDNLK